MHRKFVFLTIFLIFFHEASSACGKGTLSCEKKDTSTTPVVCDFFNFYLLNAEGTMCELNKVTDCQVSGLSAKDPCLVCESGFIFDATSAKCEQIPDDKLVKNCEEYHLSKNVCALCGADFYLSDGECLAISDVKVDNCESYSSATECRYCVDGYRLVDKRCQTIGTLPNCHLHTNVECLSCQDGMAVDLSRNPLFKPSELRIADLLSLNPFRGYWTGAAMSPVCQATKLTGCVKFANFENCDTCKEGYYLTGSERCERVQEDPVANCFEYLSSGVCKVCKNKFFLDSTEQICQASTSVTNCEIYEAEFDGCKTCKSTHLMDGANECPVKRTSSLNISNCILKNSDRDECSDCAAGYLISLDFLKCYPVISNCLSNLASNGLTQHNTCALCAVGYHPDTVKKTCIKTVINNCETVRSQLDECEACSVGYYWDSSKKSCERQSVANCEEYQVGQPNCSRCRSLFFLQANECKPLTKKDRCFSSDGIVDVCKKCDRLYFFDLGKTECPEVNSRTADAIDTQCTSNDANVDSSRCTQCAVNNFGVEGIANHAASAQEMASSNCSKIDEKTGLCSQCVPNSSGNVSTSTCSLPNNGLTTLCEQLRAGAFVPLNETNCGKCRNSKTHFLNVVKGECKPRTLPSIDSSCLTVNPDSDADCLTCNIGTFPTNKPEYEDRCVATGSLGSYPIVGCHIYDTKDGKCFYCESGKTLSADKLTCTNDTDLTSIFYDVKIVNRGPSKATTLVSNCTKYLQVDTSRIKCVQCASTYVMIVNNSVSSFDFTFEIGTASLGLGGQFPFVEKCELKSDSFKKADGTKINTIEKCDIGVSVDGRSGFACIRCAKGYNGNVVFAEKDKNGLALPEKIAAVGPCNSDSSMTTSYDGLGYHDRTGIDVLPYSSYLFYSNCQNSLHKMIFNSIIKEDGSVELTDIKHSSGQERVSYCVTSDSAFNITSSTLKANCEIFAFKTKPEPTFTSTSPPVDACMACKPGFRPIVEEGSRLISDCEAIPACVTTTNNLWMNACKNPTNGYQLDTDANNGLIMFHAPLSSAGSVTNCKIYSNDLSQCVLCNKGYSVVGNLCVNVPSDLTYNCSAVGSDRNKLTLENSSNENLRLMNYMSYLNSVNQVTIKPGTLCNVCKSGYNLGIDLDDVYQKCGPIAGVQEADKLDGCLNYQLTSPVKCAVCDSSLYLLNKTSGTCVAKTGFDNCLSLDGAVCGECAVGYGLDASNLCKLTNCESRFKQSCSLCKRNFIYNKSDITDELFCQSNPDSSGYCDNFSPLTKSCGKCSSGRVLFLFFETDSLDVDQLQGYSCEAGDLMRTSLPGWKGYNLETAYLKVVLDKAQTGAKVYMEYLENDEYDGRRFTLNDVTKSPAESHCFPKRVLRDCHPDFVISDGAYCLKCQNGKFLDKTTNECKTGAILSCDVYANETSCETCMKGNFLSSNKCVKYSASLKCKEYQLTQDKCVSCSDGSFLNSGQQCEVYNKNYNCNEFSTNENSCVNCKPKHYLDLGTRRCLAYTGSCEEGATDRDECTKCPSVRYLNQTTKVCLLYTVNTSCQTFDPINDLCLTCVAGKYPLPEVSECRVNPDGISGCKVYTELNKCGQCGVDMYLKDNKCVKAETTVPDCELYVSDGVCQTCKSTHVLDSLKNCVAVTVNNCVQPLSTKVCKECEAGYVMKVTGDVRDCEASSITDCQQAVGGSPNICIKCILPKVVSADRQSCEDIEEITNCNVYYRKDRCLECKHGFIRSQNWKLCEAAAGRVQSACRSAASTNNVVCDLCKDNFTKDSKGECVFCSLPGCGVCGVTEKDGCQMCRKGYYMSDALLCVQVEVNVAGVGKWWVGVVLGIMVLIL